ncbi:hypothetical protein PENANT_c011G03051 [Penicillium antarcticum]|uniref:D-lactate dehydrogenase (cytochrome) n=1 Tax=Penicillium antarcticum TaxID=416450 RepID=A0A1V6Q7D4_9EURO|nr:hypothetical protein PENANT_c011G03051 [Penicillium antarcticum]
MSKAVRIQALWRQCSIRNAPQQKQLKTLSRPYSSQSAKPTGSVMPLLGLTAVLSLLAGYGLATQLSSSPFSESLTPVQYPQKAAANEITRILGEDSVSYDNEDIETHGFSDWASTNSAGRAVAIVYPRSTEDVSKIATICSKYGVPIVAFGAGSSIEGSFASPHSGIVVDFTYMNNVIATHPDDMDVVVQPGVNWVDLNRRLEAEGLFLPLDPSPTATIGGMVSTNCSGTNAFRYGTMKDWVLNVTVVLADGKVIKTRRRPRKTSAGYNLTSLFVGAEGTLGIITEITLKLAVVPKETGVAVISFPTIKDAAFAATKLIRSGLQLAALELMDDIQMQVVNRHGSESKKEETELWAARKEALWTMTSIKPDGHALWSTDVAVPISRLAEIIELSKKDAESLGVFASIVGHVGDGNFHEAMMYDPKNAAQKAAIQDASCKMVERALEMDGTVSGEHAIGMGKMAYLVDELGGDTIEVMKRLKQALDPKWILNPGKVFALPDGSKAIAANRLE